MGYNRTRSVSDLGTSQLQPDVRSRLWPDEASNRKKHSSLKYSASQPKFNRTPSLLSLTGGASTVLQPSQAPMKFSASQSTLFDSGAPSPAGNADGRRNGGKAAMRVSDAAKDGGLAATDGKGHLNLLITLAFSRDEKFQR